MMGKFEAVFQVPGVDHPRSDSFPGFGLFSPDDFPVDLTQRFEKSLILPLGSHRDAEEVRAEVVEGIAVANEDSPGNQPFAEFAGGEI